MRNRDQLFSIAIPTVGQKVVAGILCVVAFTAFGPLGAADTDEVSEDRIVIIEEALSVEEVVAQELNSNRFAKQIAAYNGIDAISTILPVGASLQIPAPYLFSRDVGRVAFSKGDVIHSQQTLVVNPPIKGAPVFKGDRFITGKDGFVSLAFNTDTTVNIQPDSDIAVLNIDCSDPDKKCVIALRADKGELHSDITPRAANQPPVQFSVETPFLSAAVRGTAFYVDVEQAADLIGVTEGLVAIESSGAAHDLPRGKGLIATDAQPPALVDLPDEPSMSHDLNDALFSAEDVIRWNKVDGAKKYRVTISDDPSFVNPIAVTELQDNFIVPGIEAAGQYYVAISAIDAKNVLGLPLNADLSVVSIEDAEPLDLLIERIAGATNVTSTDYEGSVELQLSHSVDGEVVSRRIVDGLSDGIDLQLDPAKDWVIQARKVFSETSVSRYGNFYLLEASQ